MNTVFFHIMIVFFLIGKKNLLESQGFDPLAFSILSIKFFIHENYKANQARDSRI
jgi:hypothetical protein